MATGKETKRMVESAEGFFGMEICFAVLSLYYNIDYNGFTCDHMVLVCGKTSDIKHS